MRGALFRRSTRRLRAPGLRRNPVLAGGLAALAALLICWPFVRDPPLGLRDAYVHLFAVWSVVILVSVWLSRGLADDERGTVRRE